MRHPRRHLAAAGLALAGLVAACSSGQDDGNEESQTKETGTIRIAYLQKQGDQQYFVDQADGAREKAEELGEVEITVIDLGTDANKAINAMDTVIGQDVDAIAIVVPDQKIGPQVIGKARSAGIPLVASDDVIKDSEGNPAPFVGFDGKAMGEQVGLEAGKLFADSGWDPAETRIISAYKQDLSVCVDRVEAAGTAFQEAAGTSEVEVIDLGTDNSVVDAQDRTSALVTAHPDVKNWVVYGCNDENVSGVVTSLANAGFGADNVIGVGLGGYLACKDWKAGKDTGFRSALFIDGAEVGASAVEVLYEKVRNGGDLPPTTIADTSMVNADNWQEAGLTCT